MSVPKDYSLCTAYPLIKKGKNGELEYTEPYTFYENGVIRIIPADSPEGIKIARNIITALTERVAELMKQTGEL